MDSGHPGDPAAGGTLLRLEPGVPGPPGSDFRSSVPGKSHDLPVSFCAFPRERSGQAVHGVDWWPEIWLLTVYAKNEKATIPGYILKKISEEIKNE